MAVADTEEKEAAKSRPATASRPVWNGSISFGLVTIPVKLFTAVREKRIAFRSLHDQDKTPLKQKMICPLDGKEVHPEHIVKGYEFEKDHFIVVRPSELEAIAPKASHAIEIEDFVALESIDPVFFDKPYYISPKPEGAKPYKLLADALEKKKVVGIARIVMHGKEYLAAVRPLEGGLCLETMHFNDEVVSVAKVPDLKELTAKVDARELKMAEALIDSLTTEFDPGRYHDEYREKVQEMLDKKAKGQDIVARPKVEKHARRGASLMEALEASLAKAKGEAKPVAKRRKSA